MTVVQIGWDARSAVATADGVRVRVRRRATTVQWLCDQHGTSTGPHCLHLQAFAAVTPDPTQKRTTS